jgi:dihydrofolate reductase
MQISFIAALDERRAIGQGGGMPWHLPDDLKFFKQTTLGKPMLMGRKTWESLGGVLPKRPHLVVSRTEMRDLPAGVTHYFTVEDGLKALKDFSAEEGFVIGGGQLFSELLPKADRLYLTQIQAILPEADTFFPEVDFATWNLTKKELHEIDERHAYAFTFEQWDR